jgi:hypothetical protein
LKVPNDRVVNGRYIPLFADRPIMTDNVFGSLRTVDGAKPGKTPRMDHELDAPIYRQSPASAS